VGPNLLQQLRGAHACVWMLCRYVSVRVRTYVSVRARFCVRGSKHVNLRHALQKCVHFPPKKNDVEQSVLAYSTTYAYQRRDLAAAIGCHPYLSLTRACSTCK